MFVCFVFIVFVGSLGYRLSSLQEDCFLQENDLSDVVVGVWESSFAVCSCVIIVPVWCGHGRHTSAEWAQYMKLACDGETQQPLKGKTTENSLKALGLAGVLFRFSSAIRSFGICFPVSAFKAPDFVSAICYAFLLQALELSMNSRNLFKLGLVECE